MKDSAHRYASAGVNLQVADRVSERLGDLVESTRGPQVLSGKGAFGGLFDIAACGFEQPVLVASTDGVGTKVMLACQCGSYESVGWDIVNHCVNDILVCGARPLFFLDYIGVGLLDEDVVPAVVTGVARACKAAGCALLGGETAEMPGLYGKGDFDLVGTIVGVVEKSRILDTRRIAPGQTLIGLPSSGLHTNGYSLARKVLLAEAGCDLERPIEGDPRPLREILLEPHRSYLQTLEPLLSEGLILGLAHITGGGFAGNIERILPPGAGVDIDRHAWTPPAVFALIESLGGIARDEMYRVFNMGMGMVAIVEKDNSERVLSVCEDAVVIGHTDEREGVRI